MLVADLIKNGRAVAVFMKKVLAEIITGLIIRRYDMTSAVDATTLLIP